MNNKIYAGKLWGTSSARIDFFRPFLFSDYGFLLLQNVSQYLAFTCSKKNTQNLIFQLTCGILKRAKLVTCVLFLFFSEKIKFQRALKLALMKSSWKLWIAPKSLGFRILVVLIYLRFRICDFCTICWTNSFSCFTQRLSCSIFSAGCGKKHGGQT